MRPILLAPTLVLLAGCGENETQETYTCPNGPDFAVFYSEAGARLLFGNGRDELLPPTDDETIFAKPGLIWNTAGFRSGRLDVDQSSYLCDQMAG